MDSFTESLNTQGHPAASTVRESRQRCASCRLHDTGVSRLQDRVRASVGVWALRFDASGLVVLPDSWLMGS